MKRGGKERKSKTEKEEGWGKDQHAGCRAIDRGRGEGCGAGNGSCCRGWTIPMW